MAKHIHSDAEYDREVLLSLGGKLEVGGIEFPPPTPAVFPLLQLIKSPFVVGFDDNKEEEDITIQTVLEVFYVLKHREKAVQPIFLGHRKTMLLERAKNLAEKSDKFFEIYLRVLKDCAIDWSIFDEKVSQFGDTMKPFDVNMVAEEIHNYINQSWMGFEMIPTSKDEVKDTEKKTSGVTG